MQIPVNQIVNSQPGAYQGLTKTTFISSASNNLPVYMFHQPQNAPQLGTMLDGTIVSDKNGQLKFTKTPNPQYAASQPNFQSSAQSSSTLSPMSSSDPRQESIEKQAYFKAAIDVYNVWKTTDSKDTLEVFASNLVKTALTIKRQMKDNANGDVVPLSTEVTLDNLSDIFGPGTAQVLDEGPSGL